MEKIDLKSVKIALNRDEMEEIVGGSGNTGGGFLTSCSGAMVAGVIAYAGFFVVGSSVIGAGVAAVGFIYTSAQIGATCGYR